MAIKCPTLGSEGFQPACPPHHPHRPSGPHRAGKELGRASLVDDRGDPGPKVRLNLLVVRLPFSLALPKPCGQFQLPRFCLLLAPGSTFKPGSY